ncbi:MAG: hypothetical protein AAGD32_16810 [Planctomycetota bacterium]
MAKMIPRERVLATFWREPTDRVPVNYLCNPDIDRRLKLHFGPREDDDEGLANALGVDFRRTCAPYVGLRLHEDAPEPDVDISADWGLRHKLIKHATGSYWEPWPCRIAEMTEDVAASYPMPSPDDFDYAAVSADCERFKDYAVSAHTEFEVMNWIGRHVGDEAMYIGLATDDPGLMTFIRRYVAIKYEVLKRTLEAGRGGISFLWMGEDLGTQHGPRISLDMFREKIRPIHQPFIDLAKSYELPVMIHSCGSCSWAFNELIDMGITVIDTLQPGPLTWHRPTSRRPSAIASRFTAVSVPPAPSPRGLLTTPSTFVARHSRS